MANVAVAARDPQLFHLDEIHQTPKPRLHRLDFFAGVLFNLYSADYGLPPAAPVLRLPQEQDLMEQLTRDLEQAGMDVNQLVEMFNQHIGSAQGRGNGLTCIGDRAGNPRLVALRSFADPNLFVAYRYFLDHQPYERFLRMHQAKWFACNASNNKYSQFIRRPRVQ